tara:strand:+ start:90 stop:1346 length:1257 start_codon:yes stop_codon:yes gene_type:complete
MSFLIQAVSLKHRDILKKNIEQEIKEKYDRIQVYLNERDKRLWCANEAIFIGRGGASIVSRATQVSRSTIINGIKELKEDKPLSKNRLRKAGGGRKALRETNNKLIEKIENLVDSTSRGDPENPLRWTSKSTRNISEELKEIGINASHALVARELSNMNYSLQANKKILEGSNHEDRNEQFEFINNKTKNFLKEAMPVISVDTKKKENVGSYKNNGKEYSKKGEPIKVNTYDFVDKELGKVSPYGVYDVDKNNGWVSVGVSSDTAEFAVNSIKEWWNEMGSAIYKGAKAIYINADGGGSNGSRVRLWKIKLQELANEINLNIHVSHFPPGTSKWNKIEHKMFSFISKNWRGRPLLNRATVVKLIASTSTKNGLKVKAKLDTNEYEVGIKISDEDFKKISILKEDFHGEWNYIISPQNV